MDLGIAGKKALVCAASKGLGKACAIIGTGRLRSHDRLALNGLFKSRSRFD